MSNYFKDVAEKIKSLNEFYKEEMYNTNIENIMKVKVKEIVDFAKEHNVPIRLSVQSIINNVKNVHAGEEEEDYEESSDD